MKVYFFQNSIKVFFLISQKFKYLRSDALLINCPLFFIDNSKMQKYAGCSIKVKYFIVPITLRINTLNSWRVEQKNTIQNKVPIGFFITIIPAMIGSSKPDTSWSVCKHHLLTYPYRNSVNTRHHQRYAETTKSKAIQSQTCTSLL